MKNASFVNYAHRGASEYCPENTLLSFYTGVYMGANGIETDVQKTRDGVLVLFHDNTLTRVTGEEGSVADYTYDELKTFWVKNGALADKIPTLEDFLTHFSQLDLTFAIELKVGGIEKEVRDLIYAYGIEKKTVVTSFQLDYIKAFKTLAPEIEVGYLTAEITDELLDEMKALGFEELCPKGCAVTPALVEGWHARGFRVRAWGVTDRELMRTLYDAGVDGMTVNFPDALTEYVKGK